VATYVHSTRTKVKAELASEAEQRVLVLAPSGRDAVLTRDLLESAGFHCSVCESLAALCRAMEEGASLALIAEEVMKPDGLVHLSETLARQPPWSDFPLILFTEKMPDERLFPNDVLRALGNVTLLDRPVRVRTMFAAVQVALRSRARQYEARQAIVGRDRFLAMLAHELRNPLAAIRLALELEAGTGNSKRWTVIDQRTQQLTRLVDDLLDVARVTSGKMQLESASLDLSATLHTSCESMEPSVSGAGLTLTTSVQPDLRVFGDRTRLEQVFGNLLTNAVKYTPRGGRIDVEARREGEFAVIGVTDSGIGIEPVMQDKVFDLFAQADHGLARSQGGLGLGLTLVRTLVQLHGGDVWIHSDGKGTGTQVTVRLPLRSAGLTDAANERKPAASLASPQRVVIVEDSEDIRWMLEALLEHLGHDVFMAKDGPEGVSRILEVHPDLAFVDIGLPGFDGYEVARRVRAELGGEVRLVAVTGYGQAADKQRALESGFEAHLTKPVDVQQIQAVFAAAAGRMPLAPSASMSGPRA
jgi:two-component system, sensor histidine kinase